MLYCSCIESNFTKLRLVYGSFNSFCQHLGLGEACILFSSLYRSACLYGLDGQLV